MYPVQSLQASGITSYVGRARFAFAAPSPILDSSFTHGLPWAFLAAILAPAKIVAAACIASYLILRLAVSWAAGVRVLQDDTVRRRWWLIPLRDAIHFVIWLASFASNRVTWVMRSLPWKKAR